MMITYVVFGVIVLGFGAISYTAIKTAIDT